MPDLSSAGAYAFWREYHDQTVYKIVAFMENVENWTLDGDAGLEQALEKFSSMLDNIGYIDLQSEDQIIRVAVSIKMGRMLRLLQYFDVAYPGAVAKMLMFAKENSKEIDDIFGIFIRRNIVFERLRALSRVFASERLTIVLKALGDKTHD